MLEVCHKRLMKNENEDWQLDIMRRIKNFLNPLSANFTRWSNKLKQFVGNLPISAIYVLQWIRDCSQIILTLAYRTFKNDTVL